MCTKNYFILCLHSIQIPSNRTCSILRLHSEFVNDAALLYWHQHMSSKVLTLFLFINKVWELRFHLKIHRLIKHNSNKWYFFSIISLISSSIVSDIQWMISFWISFDCPENGEMVFFFKCDLKPSSYSATALHIARKWALLFDSLVSSCLRNSNFWQAKISIQLIQDGECGNGTLLPRRRIIFPPSVNVIWTNFNVRKCTLTNRQHFRLWYSSLPLIISCRWDLHDYFYGLREKFKKIIKPINNEIFL